MTHKIDVRRQTRMGFGRAMRMTLHGIRYRLFRSAVTVMVIVVAVAFLMNVMCEGLIKASVRRHTQDEIHAQRLLERWAAKLSRPPALTELLRRLATATADSADRGEIQQLSGLDDAALMGLQHEARLAVQLLDFSASLTYQQHRQLFHRADGTAIFDALQEEGPRVRLREAIGQLRTLQFPLTEVETDHFLAAWPATRQTVDLIRGHYSATLTTLAAETGGHPVREALVDADGGFGEAIRQAGFALDAPTTARLSALANASMEMQQIEASMGDAALRQRIAARLDQLPADVSIFVFWRLLESERNARWYVEQLQEVGNVCAALGADRVCELAKIRQRNALVQRASQQTTDAQGGVFGMGERMGWLMLVSLMVCVVGISNAMLMAVTERFREIATLKCLGAMDGTVMGMFIIEAACFGIAGGVIGALVGTMIGIGRMIVLFGDIALDAMPIGTILGGTAMAALAGVLLAAMASVYPSFRAARLAPMEAMRIE